MLCDNCGKREANVRYSENINGRKKLNLCEECSKKMGIGQIDFGMPIDFSSFLGGFMDSFGATPDFAPMLNDLKTLRCNGCGYTFEDIVNKGRLGCKDCYEVFENRIDPIIKRIQGSNQHVGRIGKVIDSRIDNTMGKKENKKERKESKEQSKIEKLQEELKAAIQEERYEEAAKLRDEIKKLEK